jgi:hypothetical protein
MHLQTSNAPKTPEKILIILGMHRSGTSCLTGSLQQAGLELGEFSEWNPHNLKGNRENTEIMTLNENVLRANGGSWDSPPRKIKWPPVFKAQAGQILAKYSGASFWGFKDPRTLLTLDGWLDLAIAPFYIGIFRHPMAVAHSLKSRNGDAMSQRDALELWYTYNRRLLKRYKNSPFPLLCFDWPEEIFQQSLNKALCRVGLTPSTDAEPFYTKELVHQRSHSAPLPWKISRLYRQLQRISDKYR